MFALHLFRSIALPLFLLSRRVISHKVCNIYSYSPTFLSLCCSCAQSIEVNLSFTRSVIRMRKSWVFPSCEFITDMWDNKVWRITANMNCTLTAKAVAHKWNLTGTIALIAPWLSINHVTPLTLSHNASGCLLWILNMRRCHLLDPWGLQWLRCLTASGHFWSSYYINMLWNRRVMIVTYCIGLMY